MLSILHNYQASSIFVRCPSLIVHMLYWLFLKEGDWHGMCGKVLGTGQCVGSSVLIKERPSFQTSPGRFHRRLALNILIVKLPSLLMQP